MGHEFASLLDSSTILGVCIRRVGLPRAPRRARARLRECAG